VFLDQSTTDSLPSLACRISFIEVSCTFLAFRCQTRPPLFAANLTRHQARHLTYPSPRTGRAPSSPCSQPRSFDRSQCERNLVLAILQSRTSSTDPLNFNQAPWPQPVHPNLGILESLAALVSPKDFLNAGGGTHESTTGPLCTAAHQLLHPLRAISLWPQ
jgi:hypothetical protein